MAAAQLIPGLDGLDETALLGLARIADRVLAAPQGFRPGPWQSDRRAGGGQEFLDFQPHAAGGDARRVDWRASARAGRLLERRQRDASSGEWWVCLDRSASMGGAHSPKSRLALQLAVAFTYLLLHREHGVACMTFSSDVERRCPPGRGRAQYARILRMLAADAPAAQPGGVSRLDACAAFIARRQSVVVVSDFLAEDAMRTGLARLMRRGGQVHALQVLDDPRHLAREQGPALLRDVESGLTLQVADVNRGAAAAAQVLARQREGLQAFCRRQRIAYSRCGEAEEWRDVLLVHLGRARRFDA